MKITIIYKDEKLVLTPLNSKNLFGMSEIFKLLREKYKIDGEERLLLMGENGVYNEEDDDEIDSNILKNSKKEEFVLIKLNNFSGVSDKIVSETKEDLIMKATGAKEVLKINKVSRQKSRMLRTTLSSISGFGNIFPMQQIELFAEESSHNSENENSESLGFIQPRVQTFLGRIREREVRVGGFSAIINPLAIREEEVNRLVNEMGFPDRAVRMALRISRNNVNNAVDLLLNNSEELIEMDEERARRPSQNNNTDNNASSNNTTRNIQAMLENSAIITMNRNIEDNSTNRILF
jgi:hypothetical protein